MKEPLAQRRTALYRFYGADGALLYVGITHDLEKRWNTHRLGKAWWHLVHRKTYEWYETRAPAESAEADAIENEHPRFDATNPQNDGWANGGRYDDPRRAEIEACLRVDIGAEEFRRGRSLPLATVLAERYGTSPMTISRLYWKLEDERVIEGRGCRWWLQGCRPVRKSIPGTVG